MIRLTTVAVLGVLVAACAPKPILYPNAHYKEVGEDAAELDIEECRKMAKEAGATPSQGKRGRSPAAPQQAARSDLQREQWVVRWLVIRDAAQWSALPVVRPEDFSVGSSGVHRRAMRTSSL